MAYLITIQNSNDKLKELDIKSLEAFDKLSKYKTNYSLEEIDNFTSKFENEVDLKKYLYENNIIELEDITKKISIRQKNKEELKKVRYGLVYKNMKKYLEYQYLRSTFLILHRDNKFLEKLVSNYRNSYCNTITIAEIKNYLFNNCNFRINIYNTLNNFFVKEIFDIDKSGEAKIKYKSLHDLAMFVHDYINNKEKKQLGISNEELHNKKEILELQKSILIGCNVDNQTCVKKLIKKEAKKVQVEGQMSFFD